MTEAKPRWLFVRADRLPFKRAGCRKCGCVHGYLGRYIQINGQSQVRWVCDTCEDYYTAGDLPRHILGDVPIEALKIIRDRSGERPPADAALNQFRCVVCRAPYAEGHHWAPRALFPDWPYELVVPLCDSHHKEWHRTMRENGLRIRRAQKNLDPVSA